MMKKVLIITYYWPPYTGSGVQRWLKFSKYLPNHGWKPFVYTPENPAIRTEDKDLLMEIDKSVEVWKNKIFEPYSLKEFFFGTNDSDNSGLLLHKQSLKDNFLTWIRGNLFIPDPKMFWIRPSIKFLKKKIRDEKIEYIISTGPPHSMHLIGLGLKDLFPNIKWIADFRDPWSNLDLLENFRLTNYSKKRHQALENQVIENADVTLTVSESWSDNFNILGSKNTLIITNGFDSNDFLNYNIDINHDKFVIGHYGLLNNLRNPVRLWDMLEKLCVENKLFRNKLEIRLAGILDPSVKDYLDKLPYLKDRYNDLGFLCHKSIIEEYANTSVLLLLVFNSNSGKGNYPGKLFEYMAAKRPILAFGPECSDTEKIIHSRSIGFFHTYEGDDLLKNNILDLFHRKLDVSKSSIEDFDRKKLTQKLVDLLNSI